MIQTIPKPFNQITIDDYRKMDDIEKKMYHKWREQERIKDRKIKHNSRIMTTQQQHRKVTGQNTSNKQTNNNNNNTATAPPPT